LNGQQAQAKRPDNHLLAKRDPSHERQGTPQPKARTRGEQHHIGRTRRRHLGRRKRKEREECDAHAVGLVET
jgi:hypothetical protein